MNRWLLLAPAVAPIGLAACNDDRPERIPGQDEQFRGFFCVGDDAYLDLSVNPDDAPAIKPDYPGCVNGSVEQYDPEVPS
jgi:hypothetical protein